MPDIILQIKNTAKALGISPKQVERILDSGITLEQLRADIFDLATVNALFEYAGIKGERAVNANTQRIQDVATALRISYANTLTILRNGITPAQLNAPVFDIDTTRALVRHAGKAGEAAIRTRGTKLVRRQHAVRTDENAGMAKSTPPTPTSAPIWPEFWPYTDPILNRVLPVEYREKLRLLKAAHPAEQKKAAGKALGSLKAGVSQSWLGRKANLSHSSIGDYLKGTVIPDNVHCTMLMDALRISKQDPWFIYFKEIIAISRIAEYVLHENISQETAYLSYPQDSKHNIEALLQDRPAVDRKKLEEERKHAFGIVLGGLIAQTGVYGSEIKQEAHLDYWRWIHGIYFPQKEPLERLMAALDIPTESPRLAYLTEVLAISKTAAYVLEGVPPISDEEAYLAYTHDPDRNIETLLKDRPSEERKQADERKKRAFGIVLGSLLAQSDRPEEEISDEAGISRDSFLNWKKGTFLPDKKSIKSLLAALETPGNEARLAYLAKVFTISKTASYILGGLPPITDEEAYLAYTHDTERNIEILKDRPAEEQKRAFGIVFGSLLAQSEWPEKEISRREKVDQSGFPKWKKGEKFPSRSSLERIVTAISLDEIQQKYLMDAFEISQSARKKVGEVGPRARGVEKDKQAKRQGRAARKITLPAFVSPSAQSCKTWRTEKDIPVIGIPGFSASSVSDYENGNNPIPDQYIETLGVFCGKSENEIAAVKKQAGWDRHERNIARAAIRIQSFPDTMPPSTQLCIAWRELADLHQDEIPGYGRYGVACIEAGEVPTERYIRQLGEACWKPDEEIEAVIALAEKNRGEKRAGLSLSSTATTAIGTTVAPLDSFFKDPAIQQALNHYQRQRE